MANERTAVREWSQLAMVMGVVALITAVVSHGVTGWLKIQTSVGGHWVIQSGSGEPPVLMAGSSLAGDGISWARASQALNRGIEGWGVAGSSPSEWEHFQHLATRATLTIVVVSPYDLNEYFLSDFRADVVSLRQTVSDLLESRGEWSYSKRLLSQYPLSYLRVLYPTAGRSEGVMVGVREELRSLARAVLPAESNADPTLPSGATGSSQEYKTERISSWSSARTLRRLAELRSASQGKQAFNGPKRLAFLRMLHQAEEQGGAIAVVLPVSPAYTGEFITSDVKAQFEAALLEAHDKVPGARWIRLDRVKQLNSSECFWDLVHMNSAGQKIATEAFLTQLKDLE